MPRRIGDIYRVKLTAGKCGYLQYLANDSTQLGSHVVLVLQRTYLPTEEVSFDDVSVHDGFFAHVLLKAGETLAIWERIGNSRPVVSEPLPIVWSNCSHKSRQAEVSRDWLVWHTNEEMRAPLSQEELVNSEVGLVVSPPQIVQRIEHSAYSLRYPRKGKIE